MRSSLYARTGPALDTEDPNFACGIIGVLTDGRTVIHAPKDSVPTEAMDVLIDGHTTEWTWDDLPTLCPSESAEIQSLPGYPHAWLE